MANIKIDSFKIKAKNGDTYELSAGVDTSTLATKEDITILDNDMDAMLEMVEAKADKAEVDALKEQVASGAGGGEIDTSNLVSKDELDAFNTREFETNTTNAIKEAVLAEYVPLNDLTEIQIDKLDDIILSGAVSLNDLIEVPIEQIDRLADIVKSGALSIDEFEVVDLDAILNRISVLEQEIQALKGNNDGNL